MIVKQPAPFLSKTWTLLNDPANSHLISWSASGDSFIVSQPDAFARELLPTVFKHNNYTSFVRQLNIYGFRKLPASLQEFSHPCFKRGQPQLLTQICRGGIPSASSAEGPQAEIAALKTQVERLSKALSYSLAELHRRGYDTLCFDWRELVFVDPGSFAVASSSGVPAVPMAAGTGSKRPAASGSMKYLQSSVEESRAEKSAAMAPPRHAPAVQPPPVGPQPQQLPLLAPQGKQAHPAPHQMVQPQPQQPGTAAGLLVQQPAPPQVGGSLQPVPHVALSAPAACQPQQQPQQQQQQQQPLQQQQLLMPQAPQQQPLQLQAPLPAQAASPHHDHKRMRVLEPTGAHGAAVAGMPTPHTQSAPPAAASGGHVSAVPPVVSLPPSSLMLGAPLPPSSQVPFPPPTPNQFIVPTSLQVVHSQIPVSAPVATSLPTPVATNVATGVAVSGGMPAPGTPGAAADVAGGPGHIVQAMPHLPAVAVGPPDGAVMYAPMGGGAGVSPLGQGHGQGGGFPQGAGNGANASMAPQQLPQVMQQPVPQHMQQQQQQQQQPLQMMPPASLPQPQQQQLPLTQQQPVLHAPQVLQEQQAVPAQQQQQQHLAHHHQAPLQQQQQQPPSQHHHLPQMHGGPGVDEVTPDTPDSSRQTSSLSYPVAGANPSMPQPAPAQEQQQVVHGMQQDHVATAGAVVAAAPGATSGGMMASAPMAPPDRVVPCSGGMAMGGEVAGGMAMDVFQCDVGTAGGGGRVGALDGGGGVKMHVGMDAVTGGADVADHAVVMHGAVEHANADDAVGNALATAGSGSA